MKLFVTVPGGFEELLRNELLQLGAQELQLTQAGITCVGDQATAYRICYWSRLATRVLLYLGESEIDSADDLYRAGKEIPWEEHFGPDQRFAVSCTLRKSIIEHNQFASLKLKDAIVDRFRDLTGQRPSVDTHSPGCRVHLFLEKKQAFYYIDLSGGSLHQRGLRVSGGEAPLKENLAAALLLRAGWPEIAAQGGSLVDPMCGSGTFLLEAAMMAGDVAPGLYRGTFGFETWRKHDSQLLSALQGEAEERRSIGLNSLPAIAGFDNDPLAIRRTDLAIRNAGFVGKLTVELCFVNKLSREQLPAAPGLIIVNPPYGERLGDSLALKRLYRDLGVFWKQLPGWQAGLLTSDQELAFQVGIRARRHSQVMNGPLPCKFYLFDLSDELATKGFAISPIRQQADQQAEMFRNRLRKNIRKLEKWARKEKIGNYRIYDRDLPEFALAIDRYGDQVHIQEYRPPGHVDAQMAEARFEAAVSAVIDEFEISPDAVSCRQRQRQKGTAQYQRQSERGDFREVVEGGLKFLVNFHDYLDTGLFLDHRLTRLKLREMAEGKRFLNLFCYTGAATIYAAAGGAAETTSVDLSKTYLDWAGRNLALNGYRGRRHRLVKAHCQDWLIQEKGVYDLIFLDPPTFSNSKQFDGHFDIQRDHRELIRLAMNRLAPSGSLVFSTNRRGFQLDEQVARSWSVEDWTDATLPPDFKRNPPIHYCWLLKHRILQGATELPASVG
jgi:23S rRNA (guanine2445-N2)-methyltransferase / 23S rRNA (guanine2069-N7)-methyltransferase